jgi:hypothetical protein
MKKYELPLLSNEYKALEPHKSTIAYVNGAILHLKSWKMAGKTISRE